MKILVLESSTSSAKAMVYDTDKKLSSVKTRPYSRMFDNMTVHNAQTVFDETLTVAKELLDGRSDIDMISLGGTWHSLCLTDKDMNPVTPVLHGAIQALPICAGKSGKIRTTFTGITTRRAVW